MATHRTTGLLVGLLILTSAIPASAQIVPKSPLLPPLLDIGRLYTLSGPYTEANLTVYLVHGRETVAGKTFVTLSEALEKKLVIVHETNVVNQLLIENVSPEVEVYIQAGEIVKGGQQDRVIGCDLVIGAKSKWTVPAFCVEKERWQQRGAENVLRFESSTSIVVGKSLKLAVHSAQDQKMIWQRIAEAQKKLELKLGVSVQSQLSPTSLQLSLETKGLQEKTERHLKTLSKIIDEHKDAVGCIIGINGRIEGLELYGSFELFRKMWPRLLRSAAIEAVADFEAGKDYPPVPRPIARAFLLEARLANQAQAQVREMVKRLKLTSLDTNKLLLLETRDQSTNSGAMIHFSAVVK